MIQRTYPGVSPPPAITAPLPMPLDHTDEAIRLATFRQSEETRDGLVAPFPTPETSH